MNVGRNAPRLAHSICPAAAGALGSPARVVSGPPRASARPGARLYRIARFDVLCWRDATRLTRHEPPQGRKPPPRDVGSSTRGRREYVRVEGAGSGAVPAAKGARAQDRKGREPTPGRSRHLHDAIRERFPNFREFDAWNERHASRDSRFLITPQLFIDIDRGHTPTLHHLYALASASGWPLERVCREFDVDFCELPRLHGALGRDRTELRLRRSAFSEVLEIPMDLAPGARPNDPVPLRDLVAGWSRFSGDVWPLDPRYLTAQIGVADNLAFPRLPSGAEVLVDGTITRPPEAPGYYAVQHPNGFSCCQVVIDHGMKISLLSESREIFPRLDYALRDVRIRGRVAAIAGRVDRLVTPRPVNLADLLDEQRVLLDPDRFRDLYVAGDAARSVGAPRADVLAVRREGEDAPPPRRLALPHRPRPHARPDAGGRDVAGLRAAARNLLRARGDLPARSRSICCAATTCRPTGCRSTANEDAARVTRADPAHRSRPRASPRRTSRSGADGRCRGCCRCSTASPRAGARITWVTPP